MGTINASILIAGQPAPDLFADLLEMEVEEDHRMASIFRIRLTIHREDQGTWTYLDDDRMQLWAKVEIKATVGDDSFSLIQGYLTQMSTHIDPDENSSYLELKGMDASCLMNLEEKIKDWPNQSDSDIAQQIISAYGLTAQADDTGVVHDDKVSTIIQRDTDMQFLRRLARRNGFECVARGDTMYFQKPPLSDPPLAALAAHFGDDTNLFAFDARVNAMRPAQVEMHQIDTLAKTVLDAAAAPAQQQLGSSGAASLAPPSGAQSKLVVRHEIATSADEMNALCQALYDEAEWLIEVSGEVDSSIYGSVLQSRKLVPVKGVGEMFSGMYYLTNVKHIFDVDHYTQQFKARRNAMKPNPGDFADGGLGLPF